MKKSYRIAFLLVFLTSPLMLLAQQVSSELAKQKALTFLTKSDKSSTNRSASIKTPRLVLANDRDEFYVFNDEANGGYVVVSGDERMPDVLGYSYTGHFDAETIPCNMRAWLEDYANQVLYLRLHPEVPASRRSSTEREEISPLLKCHYDQGKYYNDKCPIIDGEHCYTGCVATAMAQIMYYYQWPKHTTKIIPSYTTKTRGIYMPPSPLTTIDWDNMLEEYDSWEDYNDKQIDAISTLMLLCGTSVEMDYNSTGSAASLSDAAKALLKYFNYNDMVEYVKRMELETWVEILYDELNGGRPILFGGDPFDGEGHAFVVDGFKDGYFHVIWGWGRDAHGYFLLTDLNGFNYNQDAVIGIQPDNDDYPSLYAVLDNEKFSLYYDKEKSHRSGTVLPHQEDWSNYARQITECIIDPSFANLDANSFAGLFSGMWELKSIQGLENLNTSKALDMSSMFRNCSSLTSLDLSGFKTDKVTNMDGMFEGCSGLTSLDLSGFKTDKVTDMSSMFNGCSNLTSLDVSGFNTENVIKMGSMFRGCSSLTSLDLSGFKTEYVSDMNHMFDGCSNLTDLDLSGFKTENVRDMKYMFYRCSNLTSLDLSSFKTQNVAYLNRMFYGCSKLKSFDLSGFLTDRVSNMSMMFYDCSNLTDLDLSSFNTLKVTDMGYMFYGCSNLKTIYASDHWNMKNVEKSENMFKACNSLIGGAGTAYMKSPNTVSVLAESDWSGGFEGEYPYWYQFDESQTEGSVTSNPDGIAIYVDKNVGMYWEPQVMVIPDGGFNLKRGGSYKVIVTAKFPTNGTLQINMGVWDNFDQTTVDVVSTGDFQEIEVLFPDFAYNIEDCHLLFQCGDFKGTTIMKKIQVLEMETNNTIVEGNPSGDYAHIDGGPENPGYFTYKASKYHTVTYIVEGEVYMTQTYEYGDSIVMYYFPVRGGYTFVWEDLPETMPDHDIIVMGIFTVNKYKITYMIDGEEYQTVEVEFGSTITPPNPGDREGYDFAWGDYPSTMPAHGIIIYGSYTATDIKAVWADESDVKIYTVSGKELNNLQKGVNILRYKDGRTQKLIIK